MNLPKLLLTLSALLAMNTVVAADGGAALDTPKQKLSYTLGIQAGASVKNSGIELDNKAFLQAVQDVLEGTPPRLTDADMKAVMTAFRDQRMKDFQKLGEDNLKKGKQFLEENKKKPDITVLPNGLQYKVIKAGTGKKPKATDSVLVNYEGRLTSGAVFDSSYSRGQPITLPIGNVIKGWQEILPIMQEGAKWQVFIPSELAYGPNGGGAIGPNEVLIFDIELISVK